MLAHDDVVGGSVVRWVAGQQLVQQHARGVHVGGLSGRSAQGLLGGDVGDRPEQHPPGGGTAGRLRGVRHGVGESEVGDLDVSVVADQHVLGLHVAVDDARPMGGGQRGEHRLDEGQRGGGVEPSPLRDDPAQGSSPHQLERQPDDAVGGSLVEDGDDRPVAGQRRRGASLGDEALHELVVLGQVRVHHLERHVPVQALVGGLVDGGHAAPRDARTNAVAPVDETPDEGVGHRDVHPPSVGAQVGGPRFVRSGGVGQARRVPDTVASYAYLAVLVFVLLTTLPLELVLGVRVWRRPLRLTLTVLPVAVVFVIWDLYAIDSQHWFFDPDQMTGITFGILPLEELLFFIVVPIAGVMTLEAVRVVRRWPVGDEDPAGPRPATGRSAS